MAEHANNSLLILISAPSGGGKTTLSERIMQDNPRCVRAVTCTTRGPREGERDGVDYHFIDADTFLKRVQAGHFLEHAIVHGNSYGTLKTEVLGKLRTGRDVLLTIDVQGAAAIRAKTDTEPELKRALVTIFITPPSLAILEERLRKRAKDAPAVIHKRLSVARHEIAQWKHYDYLIISGSIDEDFKRMQAILSAERMRCGRAVMPAFE